MELKKETLIEMMQEYVSDLALEDKSLEWLTSKRERLSASTANCQLSAREIRAYVIDERNGRDEASEEVKELKDKLVEAIELQAELNKVLAESLDDEITKRLEAGNN